MSDLKKCNLSDAAEVITGFPFKGEKYASTGIRVVRGENVTLGNLRWDTIKCWNEPFKEIDKYSLREGDIVIGMDGSRVGRNRAQIRKEELPLILAQRVARLRAKKNFAQDFLAYVIKSNLFEQYVEAIKTGTSIPHISPQQIKEFEFIAPDKETQHRIASILSSLDDKIELNRQTNKTLEAIAQTLFKEMCLPNGVELPDGWRIGKLGEVCDVNKNTLNKKTDKLDWIDYIEISEVSKGVIGKVTRYNLGEEPSRAKRTLNHGDVVLSTVRPDRGSYFLSIKPSITDVVSTGFAVFSATKVPYSFLHLFLTDEISLKYYGHVANGGAYPAINPNVIMDMEIIIPNKDVLIEFNTVVEPLLLQQHQTQKETQTLAAIRDSLLPKLMKGEIEIQ